MQEIELFVGLKIPDTTAITTFHTLEKMGYENIAKVSRENYYKFEIEGNEDDFNKKIVKVDILVNANKNNFTLLNKGEKIKDASDENVKQINILVQGIDDDSAGIMYTLKQRLGFNEIKKMEKGILWKIFIKDAGNKKTVNEAEEITNNLLINRHYQKYKIV